MRSPYDMSTRFAVALSVSGALHLAVAAALITLPSRPLEAPPEQGVGITVIFSSGGGGEQVGEAAEAPRETATEPAAPTPPEPPPVRAAALPLPPSPPRAAPAAPHAAEPGAAFAAVGAAATSGLLNATLPASVGRKVDPVVPREARLNRWQGTVVLAVTVSHEGVPAAVDVLRSSGYALLDRSAIEAMWQWRFDPARSGGVPVAERIAIPITFRIVD
jgi:protein TonB